MSQFFASGGQSIGVSASASFLPMNVQDWFPLGWTGWLSLRSKGLSRVFSNTTVQKHQFFRARLSFIVQLSHPYMTTGKTIALIRRTFVGKVMSLLFNVLSRLVVTFLPWSKGLLISLLQSQSTVIFSSVQFNRSVVSDSLRPHELQHSWTPCSSPTPGDYSNSCPSSWWCHPAISSSVIPYSSCLKAFSASGSFPMSQLFAWGGQSTGVSALASVLPMNTQDWSPLGLTGWISLQSKRLSRVFSNTTVQKHQFFGTQLSSQSNSHIHTWPLEKP